MIDQIHIENLRVFAKADIMLSDFTVLVGPNGVGKSTALLALDLLGRAVSSGGGDILTDRMHPEVLRTRGSKDGIVLEAAGKVEEGKDWRLRFETPGADPASPPRSRGNVIRWKAPAQEGWKSLPNALEEGGSPANVFPLVQSLRLAEDQLWRPADIEGDEEPVLHANGDNLAAVLAFLNLNKPDTFERIQDALRCVVPGVTRLRFRPARLEKLEWTERPLFTAPTGAAPELSRKVVSGFELLFDMKVGDGIPAHSVSEGTLRSLGLFTAFLASRRPALVLLDDLERAIHPRALTELIQQIRGFQRQISGLQVLATTHSPYLLDEFDPTEVRLLWSDERGLSTCEPMVENPDYPKWCEIMSAGELWSVLDPPRRASPRPARGQE
ncbi:MAG: ATP-binding protein [Pseudomonadota bacterium]